MVLRLAVLAAAVVDHLPPGLQHDRSLGRLGRSRRIDVWGRRAGAVPRARSRSSDARASATVLKPKSDPISSAMPARTRMSVSELGSLEHGLERAQAPLPADEHAGLRDDGRHRQHDVGGAGDVALADLQADDERGLERLAGAGRDRAGRRPRRRRRPGLPSLCSAAASMIALVSRPARAGSDSTPQAAARSARASASATGRPPGSRVGRQPVSTAPRSPARRGTQASFAPVRSARRSAALKAAGARRRGVRRRGPRRHRLDRRGRRARRPPGPARWRRARRPSW